MAENKTSSMAPVFQMDHTTFYGCEPFCIYFTVMAVVSMIFQKQPLLQQWQKSGVIMRH